MSRLPTVGEDNDQWGSILNEYLSVEHNTDGTQKLLTEDVSRTIYVATTGDDTTGDGTSLLPYATVGKALSNVKTNISSGVIITLSIGVGTFSLSATDLVVLSSIGGAGTLTIQGTLTLVESGFTMGSAQALDPLTYAISGGNTGSWSANQWKYYFLKSGANYYPVTHNTSSTLSVAGEYTGTEIYQAQTILNINTVSLINNTLLNFTALQLLIGSNNIIIYNDFRDLNFTNCYVSGTSTGELTFNNNTAYRFQRSCSNGINWTLKSSPLYYVNNYFYRNGTNFMILIYPDISRSYNINYNVLENPNTGAMASCIYFNNLIKDQITANYYLKFINSNVAMNYSLGTNIQLTRSYSKIIIVNTNYLFRKHSTTLPDYAEVKINLLYSNFYGAPNTKWFYENLLELINPTSTRNIQITGLLFPEFESNLSATLTDNATTNIIVGNKLQNRSIVIDYTITRGTTYETAQLRILNDGTNLTLQEATPLGDVGVTFAVNFNTNEIRLACTLTSTGTGATMKYNATRVMITPLTI